MPSQKSPPTIRWLSYNGNKVSAAPAQRGGEVELSAFINLSFPSVLG